MPGRQESDIIIQKDAPKSKKETKRDSELQSRLFSLCHGDFAVGDGSLGVSRNTTPHPASVFLLHTRAHSHTTVIHGERSRSIGKRKMPPASGSCA